MNALLTEAVILCILLVVLYVSSQIKFESYKDNVHQDLIAHKIIMHDPITGKLIYTSDKSPFNY